jgi:hypothetical protein
MKAQFPRESGLVNIERGDTEVTIYHSKTLISQCEHCCTRHPFQVLVQDTKFINIYAINLVRRNKKEQAIVIALNFHHNRSASSEIHDPTLAYHSSLTQII